MAGTGRLLSSYHSWPPAGNWGRDTGQRYSGPVGG